MKSGIHPESYRTVVFKDMSNGDTFFSRSTVNTKETIEIDGVSYPVVKLEISSSSHPFYTGKSKLVDTVWKWFIMLNKKDDRSFIYVQTNLMPLIDNRETSSLLLDLLILIYRDLTSIYYIAVS